MAEGVDGAIHAMQPTPQEEAIDGPGRQTAREQLPPRDYPVLARCQIGDGNQRLLPHAARFGGHLRNLMEEGARMVR
jgi:hypothetical protein